MLPNQSFLFNNSILFKYCKGPASLRFILTKKYGNAEERNLFKRRARNIIRDIEMSFLFKRVELFIKPLQPNISFPVLRESFVQLQKKLVKE